MSLSLSETGLVQPVLTPQLSKVASQQQQKICPDCGKEFKKLSKLLIHQQSVHEQKRSFVCQSCGETFTRKDHLVRHADSKHVTQRNLLPCPFEKEGCLMSFPNRDQLRKHIKRTHEKKPLRCQICLNQRLQNLNTMAHDSGSEFGSVKVIQSNSSIHEDNIESAYDLDLKDITFAKKNQLKRHVAIFHDDPVICKDHCRKQFKSKKSLQAHLNRVRDQAELRESKLYIFNQHSIVGSDNHSSQNSCEITSPNQPNLSKLVSHLNGHQSNLTIMQPPQLESGSSPCKFDWERQPSPTNTQGMFQLPTQLFLKRDAISQKQTSSPFLQLDSDSSDDLKMCLKCGKMQSRRESNISFIRHVSSCSSQRFE